MATRSISILREVVPASGARLGALSQFGVNNRYSSRVIVFPDRVGAQIQSQFTIPADYVATPTVEIVMPTIGTGQSIRWRFEYNVIADNQSMDPGSADETLGVTRNESANPLRNRSVTVTPAVPANFNANEICLWNLIRRSDQAADDSYSDVLVSDLVFRYSDV